MASIPELPCEACGQLASPEHIARRLLRLEWSTRYRPVHIQALLVSAIAPLENAEFLYAPDGRFQGEAGALLDALGISRQGKSADAVLSEFQKRGLFLIHVLECPLEDTAGIALRGKARASPAGSGQAVGGRYTEELLERRVPAALARIRRSVKPKRVVLFSAVLASVQSRFSESQLGVPVISHDGQPFQLPLSGPAREGFLRATSSPIAT
jgi:hypothetical protein